MTSMTIYLLCLRALAPIAQFTWMHTLIQAYIHAPPLPPPPPTILLRLRVVRDFDVGTSYTNTAPAGFLIRRDWLVAAVVLLLLGCCFYCCLQVVSSVTTLVATLSHSAFQPSL